MPDVNDGLTPARKFSEPIAITFVFLVLLLTTISNHEMWRDEYQSWQLARFSTGFIDLIRNCRYEGHPVIWNLLLLAISRFTVNPFFMQLAHAVIATATVAIISFAAPFSRYEKIGACFGYFLFYEYAVISRNYALGVLGIMVLCSLMRSPSRNLGAIAVTIFLMSNTSVYALAIGGTFTLYLLASLSIKDGSLLVCGEPIPRTRAATAIIVILLGAAVAVLQILPPSDYSFPFYAPDYGILITAPLLAFLPVPEMGITSFWNTSIFWGSDSWRHYLPIYCIVVPALFTTFAISFRRCRAVMLFFLSSSAVILLLHALTMRVAYRYNGFYFVTLLASIWLFRIRMPSTGSSQAKPVRLILIAILATQLAAGSYAVAMELRHPFSLTAAVGRYLVKNNLTDRFIFGTYFYMAAPLSAITGRPVYTPETMKSSVFATWNKDVQWSQDTSITAADLVRQVDRYGQVVAILSFPMDKIADILLSDRNSFNIQIQSLATFDTETISSHESPFYLYLLTRKSKDSHT